VGVAIDGKRVVIKGYGSADLEHDVPIGEETIFEAGSVSKQFTAAAMLLLARDGKLSIDDPARKYIPELPAYPTEITIRHLLTHTSGLRDWGSVEDIAGWPRTSRVYTHDHVLEIVSRQKTLNFTPGTQWSYSNTGMLIAGAVVEKAAGTDYYAYVRSHVTGPAGMANTDCYETDKANRKLAVGYEKEVGADGAVTWHNNLYQHVVRGGPAGGGYSTVEDLFRFDQALRAEKLVTRESLDQLWRAYPELASESYGLGFVIDQSPVGRIVGHSGGFNGISAVLSMYLDAGWTIAVMSNLGGGAATVVEGKARELIAAGR